MCVTVHLMAKVTRTNGPLKNRYTTNPNMKGFDDWGKSTAKRLIKQGWVGRVGSKGHLVMHAPDGVTTVSLCRDNSAPRIRENALAEIKRWEVYAAVPKVAANESGQWLCPECGKPQKGRIGFVGHFNANHSHLRKCVICGQEFKTPSSFMSHMRAHAKELQEPQEVPVVIDAEVEEQPKPEPIPELEPTPAPVPEPELEPEPVKAEVARIEPEEKKSTLEAVVQGNGGDLMQSVKNLSTNDLLALANAINQEVATRTADLSARMDLILEAARA